MAVVGVRHSKVVTIPDDPNYPVGSDEWNAAHVITGLENVDNTSDVNKPVSTAQAAAIAASTATVTKASIGLGSVDNTSDVNKPISTATQAALNAKLPVFNAASYASVQAAADAANAVGGGWVFVPSSAGLSASSKGLNLDGYSLVKLFGPGGPNGGAAQPVYLSYAGTGAAISAIGSYGCEIYGLFIWCTVAGTTNIDGTNSANLYVHDNVIYNPASSASNIGVNLDNAQNAIIGVGRNTIAVAGGTGVRGVAPAGSFSVGTKVHNNLFLTACNVCIEAPGQVWSIDGNVAQNPGTNFIKKGPANTCDVLNVRSNDIDDITGTKTLITSNAAVLNSKGNRFGYVSGTITCIAQDNSTGTVNSDGDRLSGTVGIAIGTGNYLSIEAPAGSAFAPATLYTGTPANTDPVSVKGGPTTLVGQTDLGKSGAVPGVLKFWNNTAGSNFATLQAQPGAIGGNAISLPAFPGILVNKDSVDTLTNKTFDTAGAGNSLLVGGVNIAAAWTAYTPILTPSAGALGTNSATGAFKTIGKTVFVTITIAITSIGTATGDITLTLPVAAGTSGFLAGGEDQTIGKALKLRIVAGSATSGNLKYYDNTSVLANNTTFILSGVYQAV